MHYSKMLLILFKDRTVILLIVLVVAISLVSFIYISAFVGLALPLSLLVGLITPLILFSERRYVPNLFGLFASPSQPSGTKEFPRSCSICGGEECTRQYQSIFSNTSAHAHINFTVPQSIDEALEELLNLVLDHHIYSWYKEISVHDQLADEIRYVIRYAAASLATRLTKVDLTSLILERLIPSGLSHLDAYLEGRGKVRGNALVETTILQYLNSKEALHPAALSREDEKNYLRKLVTSLLPYLIPVAYQESGLGRTFLQELLGPFLILRGMDLLGEPDIINFLVLLLLEDEDTIPSPPLEQDPPVLLLKSFASVNTHPRNSVLRSNLSSVLKDQTLLYLFHIYLKSEGAINILSFCLAVEDFNRHILDPDLTFEQLQNLHREALDFYHTYMVPTAVDKLHFEAEIVSQIREIVHSEVKDIVKLRTTRPLFQAYEYAYNLLEKEYLPSFMNSNAYLSHICGSKDSQTVHKNSNSGSPGKSRHRRSDSSTSASFSPFKSKIAKAQTDESDTARATLEGLSRPFRDLSAWRVAIPRVEERLDVAGKLELVFIVDVTRIDVSGDNPEEMHWEVERRLHEFYVLEAKLTEFHGEFGDNVLPPKRSLFSAKGSGFIPSRRQVFEEFLQKLLQKPCLRNSQLLFLFFKSKDEFTASYLPDVSLSRLLKEVPRKLIKERGQNLDAFLSSFVSSTSYRATTKVTTVDFEEALRFDESNLTLEIPEDSAHNLTSGLFGDNARSFLSTSPKPTTSLPVSPLPPLSVNGVVEMILFLAVRLYGISMSCLRWAMCLKVLLGATLDSAITFFLRRKLGEALDTPSIVKLVHLIRDALFLDPPLPRTAEQQRIREKEIREAVVNLVPRWLQTLVFDQDLYLEGANAIVDLFQCPVLNKQLSYVLLDIVLDELFPELRDEGKEESKFLISLQHQQR